MDRTRCYSQYSMEEKGMTAKWAFDAISNECKIAQTSFQSFERVAAWLKDHDSFLNVEIQTLDQLIQELQMTKQRKIDLFENEMQNKDNILLK